MGITQTQNEEQISQVIKEDYISQNNQNLLHKKTQEPCTLHKITTTSRAQSNLINRNITAYEQSRCNSISRLRQHYHLENGGYCSDEETFYLIFYGQESPSVRQEYLARRYAGSRFSPMQIENILGAMLCGLRQYCKRFNRADCRVGLQSVGINIFNKNKLYLKQPWLSHKNNASSESSIGFCTTYPSPQKLQSLITIMSDYDQFRSDLFTIGMNGLELISMNFRDDVYATKKYVDRQRIMEQLNIVKDMRLRSGLEILLSENPLEREKIYGFWRILGQNQYYLPYLETMEKEKKLKVYSKHGPNPSIHPNYPDNFLKPLRSPSLQTIKPYNLQPLNLTSQTYNPPSSGRNTSYSPSPFTKPTSLSKPPTYQQVVGRPITHQPYRPTSQEKKPQVNFNKPFTYTIPPKAPTDAYPSTTFRSQFTSQFTKFNPTITTHQNNAPLTGYSNLTLANNTDSSEDGYEVMNTLMDEGKNYSINIKQVQCDSSEQQQPSRRSQPKQQQPPEQENRQKEEQKVEKTNLQKEERKEEKKYKTTTELLTQNQIKTQQNIPPVTLQYQRLEILEDELQQPSIQALSTENQPESPSTLEVTQRTMPLAHNNSTIVEVNEETPNDSEEEQSSSPHKYEFLVEEYESGSRYEGYKKNGVRNGRGKFYYQDGGYYDGQWKNNQMHGWGKLYYQGGKLAYEGNWANDQFHGYGKVYNDSPVFIPKDTGFDYTNFDMLDDYWEYYEGLLSRDTKEGRGKIQLSNGEIFEGDFHNDRIQGFGKFTKIDGVVIEGIWRDSRLIKVLSSG